MCVCIYIYIYINNISICISIIHIKNYWLDIVIFYHNAVVFLRITKKLKCTEKMQVYAQLSHILI